MGSSLSSGDNTTRSGVFRTLRRLNTHSEGITDAMARSLIAFPIRLGLRAASIGVDTTMAVAGHAMGLAGRLAEVLTGDGSPDLDIDGTAPEPRGRARPAPAEPRAPRPAAPRPAVTSDAETPPAVLDETPAHVSEEPVLVDEVAEAGAEDGAGAEVHVDEPWENYDQLGAADVIDQITGAPTAVLAAVGLYEQSHRRRKTVLEAVERQLRQQRQ